MQFSYELTERDFTQAYRLHRNRHGLIKWFRRLLISVFVLCASVIFLGFLVKPSAKAAHDLMPFFLLTVMWIILLWILPLWSMRRQFSKQPGAHGPRTVTLDSSGAHWRWNGGSSDVEWRNSIRSIEGKNLILFYTSPACFNILPKRAVLADQLDNLRQLIRQNIERKG